jgi:small subunit ribosomal protein S6
MNSYEVTYILDTKLGDDASTATMERFAAVVNDNKGEVRQVKPWGKRRFAYELKGRREGLYVTMQFAAEPDTMAEVRRQMSLSDDVLRSLFLANKKS